MMKRIAALSVLSTAIAATGFTSTAAAETWSPTGPITLSSIGSVSFYHGFFATCPLSTSGTLNGSSASIGVIDPDFIDLLWLKGCFDAILFMDQPYNLEPSGLNSVTFQNVRIATFRGECVGDLTGAFDQATGRITFVNATVPSVSPDPFPGPCVFNGIVETTPQASYTIP